jgi:hypothetical protein
MSLLTLICNSLSDRMHLAVLGEMNYPQHLHSVIDYIQLKSPKRHRNALT